MPDQAANTGNASRGRIRLVGFSTLTVCLMILMVAIVAGGFFHLSGVQTELSKMKDDIRVMRISRQAVIEVDQAVLATIALPKVNPDIANYYFALSALEAHPPAHFPGSVERSTGYVAASELVADLRYGWAETIRKVNDGEFETARAIYLSRGIRAKEADLVRAFSRELDDLDKKFEERRAYLGLTTSTLLLMQILSGLICIVAFMFAARSMRREAASRALAVTSANSTREQVMRLFEMTDMLQSAVDYSDANAVLRSTAAELLPDFGGALYVFNNSRDRLTLSTTWQIEDGLELPDAIGIQQCWALKRGKPHYNYGHSDKLCCEHHSGDGYVLEIPMIARGEILGLLQVHALGGGGLARLQQVANIGSALADAMSLAVSNIMLRDKLRSQALRDPLTGLYNRRYMEDTLHRVVRLAERDKHEVSVIMIDLDHFKRLNDQHGHAKGDSVLRDSAAAIIAQLRETDIACRYGGEELIVVLPNCGVEMAASKAERIRLGIKGLSESGGAQVSASFGVASIPSTSTTTKDMLAAADAALYKAKQEGRDRVVCAAPLTTETPADAPTTEESDVKAHRDDLAAERSTLLAAE